MEDTATVFQVSRVSVSYRVRTHIRPDFRFFDNTVAGNDEENWITITPFQQHGRLWDYQSESLRGTVPFAKGTVPLRIKTCPL